MNYLAAFSLTSMLRQSFILLKKIGEISRFAFIALIQCFQCPLYINQIYIHTVNFGLLSLPIIAMSSFFMGMVFVIHTTKTTLGSLSESIIVESLMVSMTRELTPILVGLLMSGRVGAAISSEMSSMKITEQIDVLKTFLVNPIKYLVVPRIIASLIAMPILAVISVVIGMYGGFVIGTKKFSFNGYLYWNQAMESIEYLDFFVCITKITLFGFIITIIACYNALNSPEGATGVGYSTTKTVINASLYVLLLNYIITSMIF